MPESQNRDYEINKVHSINVRELTPNPEQPRKYFTKKSSRPLRLTLKQMAFCKISLLLA